MTMFIISPPAASELIPAQCIVILARRSPFQHIPSHCCGNWFPAAYCAAGAFLVPYLIMLLLCGMPMFYMELAAGQYFSLGPIGTWAAICPLFKGLTQNLFYIKFISIIYIAVITVMIEIM